MIKLLIPNKTFLIAKYTERYPQRGFFVGFSFKGLFCVELVGQTTGVVLCYTEEDFYNTWRVDEQDSRGSIEQISDIPPLPVR